MTMANVDALSGSAMPSGERWDEIWSVTGCCICWCSSWSSICMCCCCPWLYIICDGDVCSCGGVTSCGNGWCCTCC